MSGLLATWLVLTQAVATQTADYSLSVEAWNGVGYLATTGEEARVTVKTEPTLDLGRIRPSDVLFWLYPSDPMPVSDLLHFVREGGHLILADDAGAGEALFRAIGLERSVAQGADAPEQSPPLYADRRGLPMWTPPAEHFLFFNVDQVVGNHPATLKGDGEVVLPAGPDGEAMIIEVSLGDGAVLAIGDPSLFLNAMLRRFYGNKQLAANIMRYYCLKDPCQVHLALPKTEVVGHYRSGLGRLGALPRVLDEAVLLINTALQRADSGLASPPWPVALVLILLGLSLLLARSLLLGGRRVMEPIRQWPTQGVSPLRHDVAALVAGHEDADFTGPTTVLLNEVTSGDIWRLTQQATGSELSGEGDNAWRSVHEAVLRIRKEADSVRLAEREPVSAERFLRLLRDVRAVGQHLESTARPTMRRPGPPPAGTRTATTTPLSKDA